MSGPLEKLAARVKQWFRPRAGKNERMERLPEQTPPPKRKKKP